MVQIRNITESGITSELIRFWSRSKYSHSEVWCPKGSVGNTSDGWLGARFTGGVQVRPPDYCKPTLQETMTVHMTVEQEKLFWNFMKLQLGKGYDWLAIISFVIRFKMRLRNKWFCSELQQAGLEYSVVMPHIEADLITPGMLGWFLRILTK